MAALYLGEVQNPSKAMNRPVLILLGIVFLVMVTASIPQVREQLRTWLIPEQREILAKVEGDLTGQGDFVTAVKIRTRTDLIVEVYAQDAKTQDLQQRARIVLPEKRDGYFQLHGTPTNLALVDINGDGILELAVPTFDENLIPRLHIYRYDPAAQIFVLAGPDLVPAEPIVPKGPTGPLEQH
jgi:hypothetical protein